MLSQTSTLAVTLQGNYFLSFFLSFLFCFSLLSVYFTFFSLLLFSPFHTGPRLDFLSPTVIIVIDLFKFFLPFFPSVLRLPVRPTDSQSLGGFFFFSLPLSSYLFYRRCCCCYYYYDYLDRLLISTRSSHVTSNHLLAR